MVKKSLHLEQEGISVKCQLPLTYIPGNIVNKFECVWGEGGETRVWVGGRPNMTYDWPMVPWVMAIWGTPPVNRHIERHT